jgi:hypothetical protein
MDPSHPLADTIGQIRAAIDAPWESVAMTLALHPADTLGDPGIEGTAAWHLRHAATVFRLHAHHLVGPETDSWPPVPPDTAGAIATLQADAARLTAWARDHLNPSTTIVYGQDHTASDMLGVMLRHIVWHAAAAHYWCRWKNPQKPGKPA